MNNCTCGICKYEKEKCEKSTILSKDLDSRVVFLPLTSIELKNSGMNFYNKRNITIKFMEVEDEGNR